MRTTFTPPVSGEKRVRTFFAWLPLYRSEVVDGGQEFVESRWLESVTVEEQFSTNGNHWWVVRYIDEGE